MKPFLGLWGAGLIALAAPAAAAGISYDCDSAAGHFSDLVLPTPQGPFTVTGKVQVNHIATDKKWAPTARLRIGSAEPAPGAAPDNYAGFELTALPGKSVSMSPETVQAFSFDAKGREAEMIPASLSATGAPQPFSIGYDGRSVAVSIAGQNRTYQLTGSAPVVEIVCSTGEFLFTELTIQHSR
jgi:hypothetical protein